MVMSSASLHCKVRGDGEDLRKLRDVASHFFVDSVWCACAQDGIEAAVARAIDDDVDNGRGAFVIGCSTLSRRGHHARAVEHNGDEPL